MVMINCGATEDIRTLCSLNPMVRVIVVDSHRPIWHGHRNSHDVLVVVDHDDPVPIDSIPEPQDLEGQESGGGMVSKFLGADVGSMHAVPADPGYQCCGLIVAVAG